MPKIFENASVVKADATSIPLEKVPEACASLRDAFNSDKTLSKEWRVSQLKALQVRRERVAYVEMNDGRK